jgi:hypothetical protein
MSSLQEKECSICENFFVEEDDLVTTSCHHIFHRTCAENRIKEKNKSDCRVCQKPSALADALHSNENVIKNECSICKEGFDPKPDFITTSCQHKFHRTCAESRVKEKNKSDCRVCRKSSALADALLPNEPISGGECSICEATLEAEEDLIVTNCRHTFHRTCAENRLNKKNKSECRVCQRPGALADALLPNQSTIEGECSICEEPLDHLVTTSCCHTFHRACAQKLLNEEHQTDCHVCLKKAALVDALRENIKTSTRDSLQPISKQIQPQQNVSS